MKALRYITPLFIFILLSSCARYINEKYAVYYQDWNEARGTAQKLLSDADPKTFKILKHNSYAKDKNFVYFKGRKIEGADASSFTSIGKFYAKDKNSGYYAGDQIKTSRGGKFRVIDSYYSTDEIDIFYITKPLNVCSVKDFRFVFQDKDEENWERWTTDGCYYYLKNFKIPSEDYNNVFLFKNSGGFAKDKKFVYFLNRKINYDEDGLKIIDTVDVESFVVLDFFKV